MADHVHKFEIGPDEKNLPILRCACGLTKRLGDVLPKMPKVSVELTAATKESL